MITDNTLEKMRIQYQDVSNKRKIINSFLVQVDMGMLFAYNKYKYSFSDIEIQTCLVLAIDILLINKTNTDPSGHYKMRSLDHLLLEQIRKEVTNRLGLTQIMVGKIKKLKSKKLENFAKPDLSILNLQPLFGVQNTFQSIRIYEQEFKITKKELCDYLYKEFGPEITEMCISHYMYGNTFRELAKHSKHQFSGIRKQLIKAWDKAIKFFKRG